MKISVAQLAIHSEHDTITARRLAQNVAELAGYAAQDRTKLATAVSEIARNALKYAGGGLAFCSVLEQDRKQYLVFEITDEGPGIDNMQAILEGAYRSRTGMGVGISGSKKLMDLFSIETEPERGTSVTLGMELRPRNGARLTEREIAEWSAVLVSEPSHAVVEEARHNGIEMARSLRVSQHKKAQLSRQLSEVERLNRELEATKKKLQEQATIDALTGLPNRRSVMDELLKELARSRRAGQPIAVAIADLDHFKNLNDTRGHLAGDNALREAATRMRHAVRVYDTVGRYGGEEFLFVLPGCDAQTAAAIAERVRQNVGSEPMLVDEGTAVVTCSIGLVSGEMSGDVETLIDIADAALYRAKDSGRDRVVIATPEDTADALKSRREREASEKDAR